LSPGGAWKLLKRTIAQFRADGMMDWAAALTYYSVLSIFPALIVLLSILGLVGDSATEPILGNLDKVGPGPAHEIVDSGIKNVQSGRGAAGVLFVVSLAVALWTASGYVGAFMRASNAVYGVGEHRPMWKTLPLRLGLTLVLLILVAACGTAVVLTGGLAEQVGNLVGLGSTALGVWDVAKWPVLLLLVSFLFALLYWASPNVRQADGFRLVTAGGLVAVLVWVAASAGFAFYVSKFGSYNETYGSIGGVIVFLVWLWISNMAVLLGAELNAEVGGGRAIDGL
jgi:membrane protein